MIQGLSTRYDYAYDISGRLSDVKVGGVVRSHYDYDQQGNRLGAGAVYDSHDRLVENSAHRYTYNKVGDLLTKNDLVTNLMTTYTYDVFGSLKSVVPSIGSRVDYLTDGQRHRVVKKVDGVVVKKFVYDEFGRLIAELDASNNLKSRFVYVSEGHSPDYMVTSDGSYRFIKDQVGSVKLVVDVASGVIAQHISYDEYGVVLSDTNPRFQPFGFVGGLYDSDTKLVRFGARDYDATIGRWTTKDPIGFNGGDTNLYNYVGNNPMSYVDPTGLYTEVIGWTGVGGGSSSFGHISVNINGLSYSFGPGGLDIRSAGAYLGLNGFRDGKGIILNLTPGQEAALANNLKNNSGSYSSTSNNCGGPLQSGLSQLGILSGSSMLPTNVMSSIANSSSAIGQTFYPANPAVASPTSPWGNIFSP